MSVEAILDDNRSAERELNRPDPDNSRPPVESAENSVSALQGWIARADRFCRENPTLAVVGTMAAAAAIVVYLRSGRSQTDVAAQVQHALRASGIDRPSWSDDVASWVMSLLQSDPEVLATYRDLVNSYGKELLAKVSGSR